jgi:hypothetical protein
MPEEDLNAMYFSLFGEGMQTLGDLPQLLDLSLYPNISLNLFITQVIRRAITHN